MKINSDYLFPDTYRTKAILHIDGDAFFASIEQMKDIRLQGLPVITGGERYIAAAMSYEAKAKGVTRGMRISDIQKVCPEAIICHSDYVTYSIFARRMYHIVFEYTDIIEEYSIDECFADITGLDVVYGVSYYELGLQIKNELERKLGITFGVGLAHTKVLAKVASKHNKPAGYTVIGTDFGMCMHHMNDAIHRDHTDVVDVVDSAHNTGVADYAKHTNHASHAHHVHGGTIHDRELIVRALPIEKVWGIGSAMTRLLRSHRIFTAYDFISLTMADLRALSLSKPYQEIYMELKGISVCAITTPENRKAPQSIICSRTCTPPSADMSVVYSRLSKNIEEACEKLRAQQLQATHCSFFIKSNDFRTYRRECTLSIPTANPADILASIKKEFESLVRFHSSVTYRATGISLMGLVPDRHHSAYAVARSLSLFHSSSDAQTADASNRFSDVLQRVDSLNRKFGEQTVMFGSSVHAIQAERKKRQLLMNRAPMDITRMYTVRVHTPHMFTFRKSVSQFSKYQGRTHPVWEIPFIGKVKGIKTEVKGEYEG